MTAQIKSTKDRIEALERDQESRAEELSGKEEYSIKSKTNLPERQNAKITYFEDTKIASDQRKNVGVKKNKKQKLNKAHVANQSLLLLELLAQTAKKPKKSLLAQLPSTDSDESDNAPEEDFVEEEEDLQVKTQASKESGEISSSPSQNAGTSQCWS